MNKVPPKSQDYISESYTMVKSLQILIFLLIFSVFLNISLYNLQPNWIQYNFSVRISNIFRKWTKSPPQTKDCVSESYTIFKALQILLFLLIFSLFLNIFLYNLQPNWIQYNFSVRISNIFRKWSKSPPQKSRLYQWIIHYRQIPEDFNIPLNFLRISKHFPSQFAT